MREIARLIANPVVLNNVLVDVKENVPGAAMSVLLLVLIRADIIVGLAAKLLVEQDVMEVVLDHAKGRVVTHALINVMALAKLLVEQDAMAVVLEHAKGRVVTHALINVMGVVLDLVADCVQLAVLVVLI